jgi:hypothetical protein
MDGDKQFHIGDILSITTGILVAPDGIGNVYKILNHMTGDNLFTHQLPRAAKECRPYLLVRHAWLKSVDDSELTSARWRLWLDEQAEKYGEYHAVSPLAKSVTSHTNPLQEAIDLVGEDGVIVVSDTEEGE